MLGKGDMVSCVSWQRGPMIQITSTQKNTNLDAQLSSQDLQALHTTAILLISDTASEDERGCFAAKSSPAL